VVLVGFLALIQIFKLSLYILMFAVVLQAVLSWVSPYSPVAPLLFSARCHGRHSKEKEFQCA